MAVNTVEHCIAKEKVIVSHCKVSCHAWADKRTFGVELRRPEEDLGESMDL